MVALLMLIVIAEPAPLALRVRDVVERVRALDPELAEQAARELAASVAHRRAKWERVRGRIGVRAEAALRGDGILPSRDIVAEEADDGLSAAVVGELVLPLYAGGAIEGAVDATGARLEATRARRRGLEGDLLQAALTTYAGLITASERLRIAEQAAERAEQLVALTRSREQAGIGTEADVARAELTLLSRREAVAELGGTRRELEAELIAALVLDPGASVVPSDELEVLQRAGEAGRAEPLPELQLREAELAAAAADRRVAGAGWLPRLELFAEGQYGNERAYFLDLDPLSQGLRAARVFAGRYAAGARLSWTAWDFFVTRDAVTQAEAAVSAQEASLAVTRRDADRRVRLAVAREEQADARLSALAGGVDAAARAVRLARARYESGSASLAEVLDAELDAVSVALSSADARFAKARSRLERLRAEGKDLGAMDAY